jgi:hypothetical protein
MNYPLFEVVQIPRELIIPASLASGWEMKTPENIALKKDIELRGIIRPILVYTSTGIFFKVITGSPRVWCVNGGTVPCVITDGSRQNHPIFSEDFMQARPYGPNGFGPTPDIIK